MLSRCINDHSYYQYVYASRLALNTDMLIGHGAVTQGGVGLHVSQVDPLDIEYVLQVSRPDTITFSLIADQIFLCI